MLAIYLKTIGTHELAIGILLIAALAGSIAFNLATIRYSPRFGRRKMLIAYSVLMFISGCVFQLTRTYPVMLLGAALGLISVSSADSGPFLSNPRENQPSPVTHSSFPSSIESMPVSSFLICFCRLNFAFKNRAIRRPIFVPNPTR